MDFTGSWSAFDFFEDLTKSNRLTRRYGFQPILVSGLQGFLDAISVSRESPNIIAVDETSEGLTELANAPHRKIVKTVYMAMKHKPGDQQARDLCFTVMLEIHRQFMSKIIRERTKIEQNMIAIAPAVSYAEMDRYFCTGQACAYFQLSATLNFDLRYNSDEWIS